MQLDNRLAFKLSKQAGIKPDIPASGPESVTLDLYGHLTKSMAESLGIEWAFSSETVSHGGFKDANLVKDLMFADVELELLSHDGTVGERFYPEKAYNWRIYAMGGGEIGVQCKIFMTGGLDATLDFLRNHKADGFVWALSPRQAGLFGEGDRVDMTGEDKPESGDSDERPVSQDEVTASIFDDQIACEHCGGTGEHSELCPLNSSTLVAAGGVDDRSYENKPRGGRRKK